MPVLGLGTWQLAGIGCERIVKAAIDLGYRHFDTAELYGNEREVGRAIRGVERSDLFITSKVSSEHLRANDVIHACANSLGRLETDYLDLYLIHWPNDAIPLEETMDGMQYLVEEGMVHSVGVSNFDVGRMRDVISASQTPLCNNQVEYHPYRHRREIPQFCREHNIALTAYCPLAKGRVLRDRDSDPNRRTIRQIRGAGQPPLAPPEGGHRHSEGRVGRASPGQHGNGWMGAVRTGRAGDRRDRHRSKGGRCDVYLVGDEAEYGRFL